jgi:hypothetical protein
MAVRVNLINKDGVTRKGVLGFSWTTFFFGFFVPLFRGDWLRGIAMLFLSILPFCVSVGYFFLHVIFFGFAGGATMIVPSTIVGHAAGASSEAVNSWNSDLWSGMIDRAASEASLVPLYGLLAYWLVNLMFSFAANKKHTIRLLKKGYSPADERSRRLLAGAGLIAYE